MRVVDYAALRRRSPVQFLWTGGPLRGGGRFTPVGGFEALYVAADLITAMAEAGQILVRSDGSIAQLPAGFKVLYPVEGVLTQVLDLTDPGIQARIGTTRQELTGAWLPMQAAGEVVPTQLLGRLAYESGRFMGLMSNSSENPAGNIIVVFRDRLMAPNYLEVKDPTGFIAQRLP